jgi:hypothetical protein
MIVLSAVFSFILIRNFLPRVLESVIIGDFSLRSK